MRRRWLVTGATGKLGGHLLEYLYETEAIQQGSQIVTASRTSLDRPDHIQIDLTASHELEQLLSAVRPTHILHLAAITSVEEAAAQPVATWRINVDVPRR